MSLAWNLYGPHRLPVGSLCKIPSSFILLFLEPSRPQSLRFLGLDAPDGLFIPSPPASPHPLSLFASLGCDLTLSDNNKSGFFLVRIPPSSASMASLMGFLWGGCLSHMQAGKLCRWSCRTAWTGMSSLWGSMAMLPLLLSGTLLDL